MKMWQLAAVLVGLIPAVAAASKPADEKNGIVTIPSHHSVDETVNKLKEILQAKGITLFALIDHSGEAEKVGMKMRPTKLVIFGNPKGGTPLMLAAPSIAIDLPLKILVWEDSQGKVWLSPRLSGLDPPGLPFVDCLLAQRNIATTLTNRLVVCAAVNNRARRERHTDAVACTFGVPDQKYSG